VVFLRSVDVSAVVDLSSMWIACLSLASGRDFSANLNISIFLDRWQGRNDQI
jgi:hypothetical protein